MGELVSEPVVDAFLARTLAIRRGAVSPRSDPGTTAYARDEIDLAGLTDPEAIAAAIAGLTLRVVLSMAERAAERGELDVSTVAVMCERLGGGRLLIQATGVPR